MLGSRSWRALMRRNFIYRRRNVIGTICEFLLPILAVAVLVGIKEAVKGTNGFKPETVPANFPDNADAFVTLSFTDFVTALQARRTCFDTGLFSNGKSFNIISGIPPQSMEWQVPFVKCDARNCRNPGENAAVKYCEYSILALAPSSESDSGGLQRAKDFESYILNRYPVLNTTLAAQSNNSTLPFSYPFVKIFSSEKELEKYVTKTDYGDSGFPKVGMGVVFTGNSAKNYDYKLRLNATNHYPGQEAQPAVTTTPETSRLFADFARRDKACAADGQGSPNLGKYSDSCTHQYVYNGALVVQRLVNDFILVDSGAKAKGSYVAEHGVSYVSFPSRQYVRNGFYAQIAPFAALLVTLGLLYPVAAMIRAIVLEKELRQKELMKMMSVTESDIQWAWFVSFFTFYFFTAIVTGIVTSQLYSNSQAAFLVLFWIFTFLAIITFCMTLSTLTSKSTRATLIGLLVFFIGYFLTLAAAYDTGSSGTISLISLHPVGAFSYGLQQIGDWEDKSIGVTTTTFSLSTNPSKYTVQACFGMLIFDAIFWGIISWYLNRVLPSDYGQRLPFYFPFTLGYWCPNSSKAPTHSSDDDEIVYDESIPVEPVSDTLKAQAREKRNIEIRGLTKRFGDKTAVDCLNLSMYNGQITGLLGHNGAGKTTTINMLTGMLAPTEGYATVSGKDIKTQMPQIRQEIGVCLQHDCLFPQLTVREHVQFFARIKGLYARVSHAEAEQKVDTALQDVALSEKSHSLSKNLSGGMKRKLSVAIAFCGDSKTVLLDEPTSGMDPFSRRFTWNVIRQYRAGRTIILTTHFMDEADLLSDRIAIMAEGCLRCVGSSLFLKKTYGVGYQLTIEKAVQKRATAAAAVIEDDADGFKSKYNESSEEGALVEAPTDNVDDTLRGIVTGAVSEAHLLTNVGTELSFQLPLGASSNFKPMFEALDDEVTRGTIETYGVSITTLEEVFLLVARGAETASSKKNLASSRLINAVPGIVDDDGKPASSSLDDRSARSKMNLETNNLFAIHLVALFKKRAINFKRDKKAWCCTTVLPSIFVLVGFLIFKFVSPNRNLGAVKLDLKDYNIAAKSGPRNPIPFNANGSNFVCQPGVCTLETSSINILTDESYLFCGAQAQLFSGGELPTCSISESTSVVNRITGSGATPVPATATDVESSSILLFNSSQSFAASQYASVYFTHDPSSVTSTGQNYSDAIVQQCLSNPTTYVSLSECENYGGLGYIIGYNFSALHVTPLYQSLVDEAIAKDALNDDEFTITTTIHPLPITEVETALASGQDAFSAWFLVVLSFPFIAGTFATFVVVERESKAKHLQTVAGVNPVAYWLSTYLWDIMNYQIPLWITVILMFAFDVKALNTSTREVVGGVITVLFFYGPASAGFAYCVSFMFRSPSMCNLFIIIFCFLIGMGGPLAQFILRLIGSDPTDRDQTLVDAANILQWLLRFLPSFCLGNGIFTAINIETYEWLKGHPITVWDNTVVGVEVGCLVFQSFFYLGLAMVLDVLSSNPQAVRVWRSICCCCYSRRGPGEYNALEIPDDDDVVQEQERVLSGEANEDLIVISQLCKVYDTGKVAVNNLSLGIPPGQCFGLLGINGAGKTTTMSMLTAEFPPTSGDATLAGYSVRFEPGKTRRRIGYCPQFDAHFQNLTGREHVELYASVKGVPAKFVREAAAAKLDEVGLDEADRDRLSAGYSGGMKRRLSLACATIGQPQIVFLDECSTGVDPVARREIWQMISNMVSGGHLEEHERTSVILTTHSMEECEALCPKIGIMANGKLRCLGSAQHLKTKFGQGFQVELKVGIVDRDDEDYRSIVSRLYRAVRGGGDEEATNLNAEDVFLHLSEVQSSLQSLTGDDYLTAMVTADDVHGYIIFKNATSAVGAALDEVASFAASELRIRSLNSYVLETYPHSILRERQDNKVRYEVGSIYKISNIFASIEENKERLVLADYGVSQTSLEQVFNMHAAEAEKLKLGQVQ